MNISNPYHVYASPLDATIEHSEMDIREYSMTAEFACDGGQYLMRVRGVSKPTGSMIKWYIDNELVLEDDWKCQTTYFNLVKRQHIHIPKNGKHILRADFDRGFEVNRVWFKKA